MLLKKKMGQWRNKRRNKKIHGDNGNGNTTVQNQCDIAKSVQEWSCKQWKSD